MQNLTLKNAVADPQKIVDKIKSKDYSPIDVRNTNGWSIFPAAAMTYAASSAVGGLSTGVAVGEAGALTAAGVAASAGAAVAISVLAAAGLFVISNLILKPAEDIIDEVFKSPAVEKQQVAKKSDRLHSQYTSLYGFDPAKVGLTRRYIDTDMVNSIFSGFAKAQAWGADGEIELNVTKDYAFVTEKLKINEHFKNNMIKGGYNSAFAEKAATYIANCAEIFMNNENVTTCHICATFYWDGTDSDTIHNLFISGGNLWGGNPMNFTVYNPTYANPQTPPLIAPKTGTIYNSNYTSNATFYVFNAGAFSETYSRRVYQGMSWAEPSTAGAKFCVFDNILTGTDPLDGFTTSPGIQDGTISKPKADGSQTLAEWLAENNLSLPNTFTDAQGNVYTQVNPYEAGMATTDAVAAGITTGEIDTTAEDEQSIVQTGIGTTELIEGTNAIAGEAATTNPTPPAPNPTPVFPPPSLPAASGLFSIYNPTLAQVKNFSQWLWSSDFIDQILKVFSDPMDAIVGFHYIYATPQVSGSDSIRVGYLDSGVSSNICSNQYVTIDCGTINCYEYYGSALDYAPYTKLTLFLPFVGFVDLDTQVYMGGQINIQIICDILTGCFTANVYSIKNSQKRLCDSYSGSCSVQLPYSSGSYMQAISAVTTAAVGGIGGGVPGVAAGVAGAVLGGQIRTQTKQGGSITGNAGSMGVKKPYLIIDRNTPKLPINYNKTQGYPSSTSGALSNFKGYTRIKDCHLDNVAATDAEKEQIMQLLKNGVIV